MVIKGSEKDGRLQELLQKEIQPCVNSGDEVKIAYIYITYAANYVIFQ